MSAAFNRCFETLEAGDDLFAPDAFFDLFPPFWRFQLRGPDALRRAAARRSPTVAASVRVAAGRTHGHRLRDGARADRHAARHEVARRLFLCEVRDGRITEAVVYCNGEWDDELRARHAAEAPMLRP